MHSAVLLGAAGLAAGCVEPGEEYDSIESAATVQSFVNGSCSTAVVRGLSMQIADGVGCANPTGLTKFDAAGNLQITSNAVLPYLSSAGVTSLKAVAQTKVVQVNSAFRTVAQQFLLYRWYQLGRCGITAAATPGTSNHESGRALDLANYSVLISAMGAKGWSHDVPGDPVHFDHLASPDIRGRDVAAFQRLWNRNNPADQIAVDGSYGPLTESRVARAPSEGFPIGAMCVDPPMTVGLDVVSIKGPDRVPPAQRAHYSITVKNTGTAAWPATTELRLKMAMSSPLHDESWMSDTVIATLGAAVDAMATGTLEFDVTTPEAMEETPVFEELVVSDGTTTFGEMKLALTVVPGMTGGESGDGNEEPSGDVQGGCSTGGGSAGWLALALVGLVTGRARRRRTA